MANDYSKKKNAELEELLKSRSLPHTGKKAELVARLHDSDLKLASTISRSPSAKSSGPTTIPNEPTSKKSALSNAKAAEFKPPSASTTVAEDEIDWEEDDSSIIPSITATTAAPNPPPTPPPANTSTPSSAIIADSNTPKTSSTSGTNAPATASSAPPASTAPSSASLAASSPTTLPASKRNAAIDPSKTHDLTVRYPEPKPVITAPQKPREAASTVAPTAASTIAPTAASTEASKTAAPVPAATANAKTVAAETSPASDAGQGKPVSKLGDDVTRLAKRMNRFGDGSGAYAIKRAAELAAGKTEEEISQTKEGNEGNTTDKGETQAELEARKLRERAKKFGAVQAPVKGLDEALPEHGAKRRSNNFEDGGRGKRFRGNDGGPRRGNGSRRGGGGGGRPAGNRNGNNNSNREGRIGRNGFNEKDRLAAEARKAKFAAPPPA